MYDHLKIKSNPIQQHKQQANKKQINKGHDFHSIFHNKIQENQQLKISKHALDRLEERNIKLSPRDMERLNYGMSLASEKGIKETLIMMDNRIFVASVKNNTVITATTGNRLGERVFTNIDGAVIV